ncbi:phage tail protein [Wolbachia endosymbiont (group A) of Brachyopa scutellaris]|uniref:phage tail protein n=1 Tax=Wolbachia endosymbiont (group A) of Brachyopa scutellaris TaxID=3066140 RepID=UPI00397809AA
MNEIIYNIDEKEQKVKLAAIKALNRTALWLKAQAAKEISEEKKIKLSLIRKRLRIFKAKTSRLDVLIRANLYDIRASTIGKIQKTRRGSKVGKHEFIGGFAAVMPKGNSGIFKREGRAALPIKEVIEFLIIVRTGHRKAESTARRKDSNRGMFFLALFFIANQ